MPPETLKKTAFDFSRHRLNPSEYVFQRVFEVLPGLLSWTIILGMIVLSFWKPITAALVIIAFDLYWLFRIFYSIFFLLLAYVRLSIEKETDWMARVRGIDHPDRYFEQILSVEPPADPSTRATASGCEPLLRVALSERSEPKDDWKRRLSEKIHAGELRSVLQSGRQPPLSGDIHHLVLIPMAKETRDIIEPGIASLASGYYPPKQILVVLALEDRASENVKRAAEEVREKYHEAFLDFLIVVHPDGLPREARVKGANATYAAKTAARYLKKRNIPFENVIVSCFDADTVVSREYFACLTYTFMVCPDRNRASFQPIPVYHNNIWEVRGFAKVMETGSSFFLLTETTNPELVTFSSHSMSFKALVDIGYWPVDMISDDSSIFWKAYLYFEGDYRVVPMYVTLSMDVADADTWWETVKTVYNQKRRWAWGVEGFPIIVRGFARSKGIPLSKKVSHGFRFLERHVAWATWSFLLTVISWLPALLAGREFSSSVVYYSSSRITSVIFTLSYAALFILFVLSLSLLPKKKVRHSFFKRAVFGFQWFLLPVTYVLFSALPALDAQTRLMFGRYMEFWVTGKRRQARSENSVLT